MIEDISGHDIAAEVKMTRTSFKGSILILEGDSDINLFKKFICSDRCYPISARGKYNVIVAVEVLTDSGFQGCLGIIDRDLCHCCRHFMCIDNLCVTDLNDIELQIIDSPAFDDFINEFCSQTKVKSLLKDNNCDNVRALLYKSGRAIGIVRRTSIKKQFQLDFKTIKYKKIVCKQSLTVDLDNLLKLLLQNKSKLAITFDKIQLACNEVKKETNKFNDKDLCVGDDIIGILAVGMAKMLGTANNMERDKKHICKSLRLSYDSIYFKESILFKCIKKWEDQNKPYRILSL